MWPFRRNTLPGKYSRDCLMHAQRTWSCSRWCCCHCCCCYCYCCYYCCCYCCCLLTHSPERNWSRREFNQRLLTTVFTVMRRKLKNEEMEKQFDPKTLEKRYNACNGMKTLIRNMLWKERTRRWDLGWWRLMLDEEGRKCKGGWSWSSKSISYQHNDVVLTQVLTKGRVDRGYKVRIQVQLRPVSACW